MLILINQILSVMAVLNHLLFCFGTHLKRLCNLILIYIGILINNIFYIQSIGSDIGIYNCINPCNLHIYSIRYLIYNFFSLYYTKNSLIFVLYTNILKPSILLNSTQLLFYFYNLK
jgi:hypothetical protein